MLHRQDQAVPKSLLTLRETVKELFGIPEFRQRTHLAALTMSTEPGRLLHPRAAEPLALDQSL